MSRYSYRSAEVEAHELQRMVYDNSALDYSAAETILESHYVEIRKASNLLGSQNQYTSRYLEGTGSFPDLGENIRYAGDPADYHSVKIHEEDIATFVARIVAYREVVSG